MEVKITLQIFGSVWFTMNAQQRQKHFSREHSLSLSDADSLSNLCVSNASSGATLSMDVDSVAKSCMYRKKALELLSKENAIVPAPGQSLEARMVLSFSNQTIIWSLPEKEVACDAACPNWKSLGLRSHSMAVA